MKKPRADELTFLELVSMSPAPRLRDIAARVALTAVTGEGLLICLEGCPLDSAPWLLAYSVIQLLVLRVIWGRAA